MKYKTRPELVEVKSHQNRTHFETQNWTRTGKVETCLKLALDIFTSRFSQITNGFMRAKNTIVY